MTPKQMHRQVLDLTDKLDTLRRRFQAEERIDLAAGPLARAHEAMVEALVILTKEKQAPELAKLERAMARAAKLEEKAYRADVKHARRVIDGTTDKD